MESDSSGYTTRSGYESTDSEAELDKAPATGVAVPAAGDAVPATGGKLVEPVKFGKKGPIIFENSYFVLKGNGLDLKMHIYDRWFSDPPLGIGRHSQMTKATTPPTLGEKLADLVRALLFLKVWMLWHARTNRGCIESDGSRQRLFAEEACFVLVEAKRLHPQSDGLCIVMDVC